MQNDYYVYVAINNEVIIYIGYGRLSRLQHVNSGISHNYTLNKLHFQDVHFDVVKYKEGLSKEDALQLESALIATHQPVANSVGSIYSARSVDVMVKVVVRKHLRVNSTLEQEWMHLIKQHYEKWLGGEWLQIERGKIQAYLANPSRKLLAFFEEYPEALTVQKDSSGRLKIRFSATYLRSIVENTQSQ